MNQNHIWHKKYKMNKIDKFYAFQLLKPPLFQTKESSAFTAPWSYGFKCHPYPWKQFSSSAFTEVDKADADIHALIVILGYKRFGRIEKFPPQKDSFKKCQNSDSNFKFSFSFWILLWKMSFQESDFKKFNHFNVKSIGGEVGVVHVEINRPKVFNSMSEE